MSFFGEIYRSRGHGIHSPFAYHFVSEVIGCRHPYAYYAYDVIDSLASSPHTVALSRLAHRVAVDRRPHSVGVTGCVDAAVAEGARLWSTRCAVVEGDMEAQMVIVGPATPREELPSAAGRTLLVLDNSLVDSLSAPLEEGMTFIGHRCSIIIGDRGLPLQSFKLWF